MYAIIKDGGKEYKVFPGQVIELEKKENSNKEITFSDVVYINSKDGISIGKPLVEGAKVIGVIEGDIKASKITVFKFKRRKSYRRKQGHRQVHTRVRIKEIVKG